MKYLKERLSRFGYRNRTEKKEYGEKYFSRTIEGPPVSPRYLRYLAPTVFKNATFLLDAGCGTGECIDTAKEFGKDAVGIDISPFAAKKSGQILGSILHLPFREETFDGVTSFEVIEHLALSDGIRFLNECYRVLQDGGSFALSTPNWLPRLWLWLRGITDLTHRVYFNPVSIKRSLQTCGFNSVRTISETELKFGLRIAFQGISPLSLLGFGIIAVCKKSR